MKNAETDDIFLRVRYLYSLSKFLLKNEINILSCSRGFSDVSPLQLVKS